MLRPEKDSLGTVYVDDSHFWGAQTQRSLENFKIGSELMPPEIIGAYAILKKACAEANTALGVLSAEKAALISEVCDEISNGALDNEFPLRVWQTGSGTQTNMNLNEVIAGRGNTVAGDKILHPNDDVNRSQSSNDTFPAAMRMAAAVSIHYKLIPALDGLIAAFTELENKYPDIIKVGRTHLQDAVPLRFSQEVSGWRVMLEKSRRLIVLNTDGLYELALGGTAVGTGLNAPKGFDIKVAEIISGLTSLPFVTAPNKFHALTSLDALAAAHGALKALAADLMKIANDIRFLASGPRCGLGEINLPVNEPGSSIMPGKVNPTQCEAVTMVCVQVMGNDAAVGFAASQGNFELNVFQPVCAYNFLQSVRLLADVMESFNKNCVAGITPNINVMSGNLEKSLMNVTALNPLIGYDRAAKTAMFAYKEGITLAEATDALGFMTKEEALKALDPAKMV